MDYKASFMDCVEWLDKEAGKVDKWLEAVFPGVGREEALERMWERYKEVWTDSGEVSEPLSKEEIIARFIENDWMIDGE